MPRPLRREKGQSFSHTKERFISADDIPRQTFFLCGYPKQFTDTDSVIQPDVASLPLYNSGTPRLMTVILKLTIVIKAMNAALRGGRSELDTLSGAWTLCRQNIIHSDIPRRGTSLRRLTCCLKTRRNNSLESFPREDDSGDFLESPSLASGANIRYGEHL